MIEFMKVTLSAEEAGDTTPSASPRSPTDTLAMLLQYKRWANEIAFTSVMAIPEDEALKPRATTFKNCPLKRSGDFFAQGHWTQLTQKIL